MEMQLGLLADNGHADASGKLYVLGEFRYISAPTVPARHGQMVAIARFVADAVEVRAKNWSLEIEIVNQDGQPILPRTPKFPMKFAPIGPAERGRVNSQIIVQLAGVVLPAYGDYSIHFIANGTHIGRIPFHLMPKPAGEGGAPNAPE